MKSYFNRILYMVIAIILAIFLISCDSSEPTPTQVATAEPNVSALPDLGKFVVVVPKSSDVDYSMGNEVTKQKIIEFIAAEKGVTLDFEVIEISKDNFTNELNQLLSSATSIDAIVADYDTLSTYANLQGLIKPIDNLLNSHGTNLYNAIDASYWEDVKHNSEIYGVPSVPYPEKSMMVTRADLLYMFTTDPIDSFSGLLAICKFYKLMGYEYPIAATWDQLIDILAFEFKTSPNAYTHTQDTNAFIMREQEYHYNKGYLEGMKLLYENGYINPNLFSATPDQMKAEVMAGRSAIYVTEIEDIMNDRTMLRSTFPDADLQIISPLTSTSVLDAHLSGEDKIDNVLMFTGNGQHSEALMTFLDWSYSSQLNHTMVEMGAFGDQLLYDPSVNQYEYVNGYSKSNKPYSGIYTLGLSTDLLYTPPTHVEYIEYTVDMIAQNALEQSAHRYLTETEVKFGITVPINDNAKAAMDRYNLIMREGAEKYISGEIIYDKYVMYEKQCRNEGLLTTLAQEIGVAYLYKLGVLGN